MKLFLLAIVWSCFLACVVSSGTELNCAVFTYGNWDYEMEVDAVKATSRCIQSVELARKRCGGTRLNFVTTQFWVDEEADGYVDYYCYKMDGGHCAPVTPELIDAFSAGIKACFDRAIALGYDIEITPHLDDGLGKGAWRNALVFDPLENYGGMTYVDIMIKPITEALALAIKPKTKVYFALQGEMSATVMRYPSSWKKLLPLVKKWVGGKAPASQNTKVGVSTNFNKLCACVLTDLVDPEEYLAELPKAIEPIINDFDIPAIQALYNSVDFIGMSNYASMPAVFTSADLENAARQFAEEAKLFGIDLANLVNVKKKRLHFSEFGVGGGTCVTGNCTATTPEEVAKTPFFGIFGPYKRDTDPWQQWQPPTANVPTREWLHRFYNTTVKWLAGQGGPSFRVDSLSMWNVASWDVLGINSDSTTPEGTYFDPDVSSLIINHNSMVASEKYPPVTQVFPGELGPKPKRAAKPVTTPTPAPLPKSTPAPPKTGSASQGGQTTPGGQTTGGPQTTPGGQTTGGPQTTPGGQTTGGPQTSATPPVEKQEGQQGSGAQSGNTDTPRVSTDTATPAGNITIQTIPVDGAPTPGAPIPSINVRGPTDPVVAVAQQAPAPTVTQNAKSAGSDADAGLGLPALIGIIAGAVMLVVIVGVVAGLFIMRSRRSSSDDEATAVEVNPGAPNVMKTDTPHAYTEQTGPGHFI